VAEVKSISGKLVLGEDGLTEYVVTTPMGPKSTTWGSCWRSAGWPPGLACTRSTTPMGSAGPRTERTPAVLPEGAEQHERPHEVATSSSLLPFPIPLDAAIRRGD